MFDNNVIVTGVVPPSLEPVVVISLFPCNRHSSSPENVGMSFSWGGGAAGEEEGGESQAKRIFIGCSDCFPGKYFSANIYSSRSGSFM